MPTEKTWQIHSQSSADTEAYGETLGRTLKGGEVIELISDLGGGKTTFVRGLARGAGSRDHVASPTFTISREYQTPKFTIIHFDFYRLAEPGVVAAELSEYAGDPRSVVVIEWGDVVQDVLPLERVIVNITAVEHEHSSREITYTYPMSLSYIAA